MCGLPAAASAAQGKRTGRSHASMLQAANSGRQAEEVGLGNEGIRRTKPDSIIHPWRSFPQYGSQDEADALCRYVR